jgi:hypothetical protein
MAINSIVLKDQNRWVSFNGSSSYIQYADNDIFSFTDGVGNDIPFEVEFDMNCRNVASLTILAYKGSAVGNYEWSLRTTSSTLIIRLWGSGNSAIYIGASVPIVNNTNYHVKITYDGSKVWTGIKMYLNSVNTTTTNSSTGTYLGMVNNTALFYIGSANNVSSWYYGYLRNLRIKKNNQLVFFIPLQDTNAVSKDVISGLVYNAGVLPTVVNKLENERWAYFDGVFTPSPTYLTIGDTATLGWMNSGIFRMEFDYKIIELKSSSAPVYTAAQPSEAGIFMQGSVSNFNINWCNGNVTYGASITSIFTIPVLGNWYKVVIWGDGSKIYYTTYNSDGTVNKTNEPTGVACTYIPNAATSRPLRFGYPSVVYGILKCGFKNFKIFSDSAGTQPFLSLPFQNQATIATDVVGGLVGTNTGVRLVNNMENVMKDRNLWAKFTSASNIYPIGTTSSFKYIHNTGIFRIEMDLIYGGTITSKNILDTKNAGTTGDGFIVYLGSSKKLSFSIANTTINIIAIENTTVLETNKYYKLKIYSTDGVNVHFDINGTIVSGTVSGAFDSGVSQRALSIVRNADFYVRNLKFYNSSGLYAFFPLQDSTAVSTDVIGGLSGTVTSVNVVNYLEREKWAYFNGVSSLASIGTTSTLGWMNSGVFRIEFDFIKLTSVANNRPLFFTAWNSGNSGIVICTSSTNLGILVQLRTSAGGVSFNYTSSAIVLGTQYHLIIYGNGTQMRFEILNTDGSILYDTGEVNTSFVPNATTTFVPTFGTTSGLYAHFQLRNFKIFTDTAGTIPFMSLPMQNAEDLMTDRVTGLVGSATAVSIINNNENVLRNKNLWANYNINGYSTIGTTSTLGWMNTGIFKVEFDFTLLTTPLGNTAILYTGAANSQRGFMFYPRTSNTMLVYWCNGSGTYAATFAPAVNILNKDLHYELYGNGSQIRLIIINNATKSIEYDNGWYSITYIPFATTTASLTIQRTSLYNNRVNFLIKNFKIFTDTTGTIPFMNLPLTDGGNIVKDIVGGLQGTIYGTIKVVEV